MRLTREDQRAMADLAQAEGSVSVEGATAGATSRGIQAVLERAARRALVRVQGLCEPAALPYVLRLAACMASEQRGPGARHHEPHRG